MEGILPVLILAIISIVASVLKNSSRGARRSGQQRYVDLAQRLRRQAETFSAGGDAVSRQTAASGANNTGAMQLRVESTMQHRLSEMTSRYGYEGTVGTEGTNDSEGESSEGSTDAIGRLQSARLAYAAPEQPLYSANKVDAPASEDNEPFYAGRESAQVYSSDPAMTVVKRPSAARRAVAIGNTLASADGMAQAVVMAEVLMHRGGRRGMPWKN